MSGSAPLGADATGWQTLQPQGDRDRIIALAGNPNVGKSTIFNALTKLKQHTGNWPGKTVSNARGRCRHNGQDYVLVDIPGCYSLMAHSAEEEVARDFICFGAPDAVVVVCDATCLERNLNLVLQVMEATPKVVVAVNLMDEAKKKGLTPNLERLSAALGVPVVGTTARSNRGLQELLDAVEQMVGNPLPKGAQPLVRYSEGIESAIAQLTPLVETGVQASGKTLNTRWLCARLLDANESLLEAARLYLQMDVTALPGVSEALQQLRAQLAADGGSNQRVQDDMAAAFVKTAESIAAKARAVAKQERFHLDRRLDRLFTSKATGFPIMLLLLLLIFWLTITGANAPSALLAKGLFFIEDQLALWLGGLGVSQWVIDMTVHGIYKVMAWVVSVMLPPMAIFFPLFTLLEDFGYLPRVAFNLDRCFKCCAACGKQALSMCMVDNGMRIGMKNAAQRAAGVGWPVGGLLFLRFFVAILLSRQTAQHQVRATQKERELLTKMLSFFGSGAF